MNPDKLLRLATAFEKRAQQGESEVTRQQMFTVPIPPFQVSFKDQAFAVFKELANKEPGLQDAGQSQGPVYQLMNMMSIGGTPDPQRLLQLAQGVRAKAQELGQGVMLAQDLVTYANVIIRKFFTPPEPQPQVQTVPEMTITPDGPKEPKPAAPPAPANESAYQFISRVYRQIRAGQGPSDEDVQKWPNYRTQVVRRLNGLKGLATRTQQQDQERAVLQALVDKLG